MDTDNLEALMPLVERYGLCLNIEEKIRLTLAFKQLKIDLGLS
jgi:hypothetical protein